MSKKEKEDKLDKIIKLLEEIRANQSTPYCPPVYPQPYMPNSYPPDQPYWTMTCENRDGVAKYQQ